MSVKGAQASITKSATSWEGVTVAPHRFDASIYFEMGSRKLI